MSSVSLNQLVAELLLAVKLLGGYAVPATPPDVIFVSNGWLESRACVGPCPVYGWFPPGSTIYLDDRLDPETDMVARGILLHEIVHYAQQESGRFAAFNHCVRFRKKEYEAYRVQYLWYARNGVNLSGSPWLASFPRSMPPCRPPDNE